MLVALFIEYIGQPCSQFVNYSIYVAFPHDVGHVKAGHTPAFAMHAEFNWHHGVNRLHVARVVLCAYLGA
jgi:hypothetical protein